MASLFKRFKKKLPAVTSKNSAYYIRENIIQTLPDLVKVLQGAPEIKGLNTQKELTFNNMPLLKISSKELRSKFDTPSQVLDRSNTIPGHKIVFFKDSVAHYKFLIQYHFIDEQFFFASNKIAAMTVLSDADKLKIINRITKKYLADENIMEIDNELKIIDPNGSLIYTQDDVYFYMHYLPANETKKMLLKKYAGITENTVNPQGFSDSLEQYI